MGAVFLGTPAAAVPSLAAFANVVDIDLVVTQPAKASSRGRSIGDPSVKTAAAQYGYRVAQPESPQELVDVLTGGAFDIGLIVAYGRVLTPVMLALTPYGFLNVHFSLLPRWRGAAPVERAIEHGDERTGVTLMKIDEGLDTGPILGEIATLISPNETGGSLTARLSHLGATIVDQSVPEYLNGRRAPVPQIASGASYAKRLTKAEAELTSEIDASTAERRIRAFQPRPTAWMQTPEGPLQIHAATHAEAEVGLEAGTIAVVDTRVLAGFSGGALVLGIVQPASKSMLEASAWMHGRRGTMVRFG